jgi:hypothetical protein
LRLRALKIAASTVQEVFGGDIAAFLRVGLVILHTVRQLLDYQFERLSALERKLTHWLAIERDQVTPEELSRDLTDATPRREVLATLKSLRWRCLVERTERAAIFTLHEVVLEYVSEGMSLVNTASEPSPGIRLGFVHWLSVAMERC